MNEICVKVKTLAHFDLSFPLPSHETEGAAGADIRASLINRDTLVIAPGERKLVPTGLAVEIPLGFEIQVRPRSGLSLKTSLMVVNSPGTIDADYRGEVQIILGNLGSKDEIIKHGDRIAQLVLAPVTRASYQVVAELGNTTRGEGGFGSTGRR